MTLSADQLQRLERLRQLFLDERRGDQALADYWQHAADLTAYDAVLAARIGWKWDAALRECAALGWPRSDHETVLDFGCGTGIAARRYWTHFGAGQVLLHDRSSAAMADAARRVTAMSPGTRTQTVRDCDSLSPDVLLVSHVVAELDARGLASLQELARRSRRVLLVEPGTFVASRRLGSLREALRSDFALLGPCTHQADCPALASNNDWCHFFAPPPPEVFTDGDWVRTARALGIDLRALPYAWLALTKETVPPRDTARFLGRADLQSHTATVMLCDAAGLSQRIVTKRHQRELFRQLRKHPETVRWLPREG